MVSPLLVVSESRGTERCSAFFCPCGLALHPDKTRIVEFGRYSCKSIATWRRLGETSAPQCRTCKSEEQHYSGELRGDTFPGQRLKTTEPSIVVQPGQSSRNKKVRFVDLQEDGDSVVKQRNLGKHPARVESFSIPAIQRGDDKRLSIQTESDMREKARVQN
jgi:hypothetical protein